MMDVEREPPYPNRVNHDSFVEAGEDKANACISPVAKTHDPFSRVNAKCFKEVNSRVIELYE